MPFGRVNFFRSFRFRVMAGLVAVVVVTMVLTTFLVRIILTPAILEHFDRQLFDEADETALEIRALFNDKFPTDWKSSEQFETLKRNLDRRARSRGNLRWFVRVFDSRRQIVFESERFPQISPPSEGNVTAARQSKECHWVDNPSPENSSTPDFWVQVGRSTEALDNDFDLLNQTLFWRGLLVVALAPVGGYFLARQVTEPIAQITTTAARLQPENLSERLPVRGVNDELDRVSITINRMLDRIAEYIQKNQAFVANAAHELRSPLAAMRSAAEVALNRSRTPEEYANVLGEMIEEVARLSTMVNRLLLLAEGDAGSFVPPPGQVARLDKIVRESIEMFQAAAESVGVQIRCDGLPRIDVFGDEANLRHLVRNLIDNAIKFSPNGGAVDVSARIDGNRALLSVVDQGIGIPPQDIPRLFERFFRGDRSRSRSETQSGSGLGLSICHAIVRAMGGEIHVESNVGKGSAFTIQLPAVV